MKILTKKEKKEEDKKRLKEILGIKYDSYNDKLEKKLNNDALREELTPFSQIKRGILISNHKRELKRDKEVLTASIKKNVKRTIISLPATFIGSGALSSILFYVLLPLMIAVPNPGLMALGVGLVTFFSTFTCWIVQIHRDRKLKKYSNICDEYLKKIDDFRFDQPGKALANTKIETEEGPKKQYAFQDPKNRRYIFKLVFREGDEKGKNITDRAGKILNITASSMEDFVSQLKQIDFGYTIVDGVKKYNNKDIQAFVDYRNDMLNGDNPRAVDMRFVATQLWRGENSRLTSQRYDSIEDFINACDKMKESLIGHSSHEEQNDYLKSKKGYLLEKQKELEEKFDNNQMSQEEFLDESKSIERRIKKLNEEIKDNKKHRKEEIVINEGKNIHVRSRRMHAVRTINNVDKPDVEDDKIME